MIPNEIINHLKDLLNITIQDTISVSGGSINQAAKLKTDQGNFFLKWNHSAPVDFFIKEADGLRRLKETGSNLRIPDVKAVEKPAEDMPGYLLMEYIHESNKGGDSFAFGTDLAKLHQNRTSHFGLEVDNYIGSLHQSNSQHDGWESFFSEERIKPQLKMAMDGGRLESSLLKNWNRLASRLQDLLPECQPSLLHGDLWSGNYLFNSSGSAVLIDPAVYYGHPEMDIAFSKMFGGFAQDFYDGYETVSPLEPGFSKRESVYNLYPLLVHANLFGGHYSGQCRSFLAQF